MTITCHINDIKATKKLAILIANFTKRKDAILLKGTLGSGKTTFAQFFIKHLTHAQNVQSPTFNIVNVYENEPCSIWHYDFYRIKNLNEIYELGLEESLAYGISVIEWPELIENIIHQNKFIIYFKYDPKTNARTVEIELHGRFLMEETQLLEKLKNEFK